MEIKQFLVVAEVSAVAASSDDVFIWKTAYLRIVADGWAVLGPVPSCLACGIDELGFLVIIWRMGIDLVLPYVVFHRGQQVDVTHVDLE